LGKEEVDKKLKSCLISEEKTEALTDQMSVGAFCSEDFALPLAFVG
jgi:hypothetical protein